IATPTQVEIVSRYPDPSDGADVVHILAHVRRPEPSQPGDRIEFQVGRNPHPRYDLELEDSVQNLLATPGAVKLFAEDAVGNTYVADVLSKYRAEQADIQLDGVCAKRIRTHEVMLPIEAVSGPLGTLPHLMGVHSFLTAYRGQDYATLDIHVHNGMDGRDPSDSTDDLLDDLYFKDLTLRLPAGWKVAFSMDAPGQGLVHEEGGYTQTELVAPLAGGRMHLMPRMSHFVRRLVLCRDGFEDRAREAVRSQYVAYCQPGSNTNGTPLWSWWNQDTARYLTQNHALPTLDYIGLGNVEGRLQGDLNRFETQVAAGASGAYPYIFPRLGWAHPWSVQYGGMAGGDEINTFSGVEVAWSGSREGLRMCQLRMSGNVDRQPQVFYDKNGRFTQYQNLVAHPVDRQPYIPLWFYGTPTPGDTFFNYDAAPSFQKEYVIAHNLVPDYEADLRGFQPSDYQHFIRYTQDMKALAWLTNDALSKELLEGAAENFRLSFHEYPNTNYNDAQPTGLLNCMRVVENHPGMGVPIGRGEAWGIDAAIATYAFGNDELRARYRPWFDKISDSLQYGQSTCTGNLMSYHVWNHFNGLYRVRQAMENAFLENMIRGMVTTVYRGVDDSRADVLDEVLVGSVRASMSGRFFSETEGAPFFNNAVGPADIELGNFCENAPEGTTSPYLNRTEYYSSLAYAYELTGDSFFLFRASQMLGGGDVLARLVEGQGHNLINTAALVELAQRMQTSQP
ncbi:MAG TPA: hypothetical protein P5218_08730, partial [Planctomycetota bacterium]|nr:hypothetical protein [Planctomycetota bacterium]